MPETQIQPVSREGDSPLPESIKAIRTETVFSKLPIHNLSKKGSINIQITKKNEQGEIELHWKVSPSRDYGEPKQLAYKLDTHVINRRFDEVGRPLSKIIHLGSLRDIADQLNLGGNTNKVRKTLRQNAFTGITAKLTYKTASGTERRLEADFTRYSVVFTGERLPDGSKADAVYLVLNDIYREVLNNVKTRPLDYEYLKALKPAPQRFYEIISSKIYTAIKYQHPHTKLIYSEYCTYSAQKRHFDYENFRVQMSKIHRQHRKSGYIAKLWFEETTDSDGKPDWIMYYVPGPKAKAEYKAFNRAHLLTAEAQQTKPEPDPLQTQAAGESAAPPPPTPAAVTSRALVAEADNWSPLKLVQYFHEQARGVTDYQPSPRELTQATFLFAAHGQKALFIVGYAVTEARKTNFHMRTFGAVLQYVADALAAHEHQQKNRELQAQAQAEQETRLRQEEELRRQAEARLAALPHEERQALYDKVKAQILARFPGRYQDGPILEGVIKAGMHVELRRGSHSTPSFPEQGRALQE